MINYVRKSVNFTLYTKINFIWITKLNVTNKTIVRKIYGEIYLITCREELYRNKSARNRTLYKNVKEKLKQKLKLK